MSAVKYTVGAASSADALCTGSIRASDSTRKKTKSFFIIVLPFDLQLTQFIFMQEPRMSPVSRYSYVGN